MYDISSSPSISASHEFPSPVLSALGVDASIPHHIDQILCEWQQKTKSSSSVVTQLNKLGYAHDDRLEVTESLFRLKQR